MPDVEATANPFPGTIPVPEPNGPVRYMSPGGGSWRTSTDDPYFHQTEDGSFKVPEDSPYHTGGAEATVRITEQKLDPGVVRIEVDIDEYQGLTEIHFIVRNQARGPNAVPEARFYLQGIDEEDESPAWWSLARANKDVELFRPEKRKPAKPYKPAKRRKA